jgi:hypothetical protein
MQTFTRIGIAVLLPALVALSGCQKQTTQSTPDGPQRLTGIGINGHMDKISGQWIPAWGYIDAQGDTVCCFWTEIEATTVARSK